MTPATNFPPIPLVLLIPVANNGNTIRLLTPYSELEDKNVSICWLDYSKGIGPRPTALPVNPLCKEPFERRYWLLFGTSAYTTTAPPQAAMSQALDWGSRLSLTWTRIYLIGRVEVRIAREGARRSNHCCVRGSRALEPQNRMRIASRRGHPYLGAWPGPLTSSA